ncbi:hypothetical protein QAD02_014144, partial [Eretmocerus hayati]
MFGFQIRRFIKSFKKFPVPTKRLDEVAADAELNEKPKSELTYLADQLRLRCEACLAESENSVAKENKTDEIDGNAPKRRRGPTFKLGGVMVNAKSFSAALAELEPLDRAIPSNPDERANWLLDVKVKAANFECEWTIEDDTRLLRGIYEHGMGSWDAIKTDENLKLGEKMLLNESKAQAKRIQARGEYLLKVLKKQMDQKLGVAKQRKPRKAKEPKSPITKELIEENDSSGDGRDHTLKFEKPPKKENEVDNVKKEAKEETDVSIFDDRKKDKKAKREKKDGKKSKRAKLTGPMHFTANNEPRALDVLGDLDPSIFNECKEKMRPVKKALKALDRPDQTLSESEQVAHTRSCLVQIGNQINTCLSEYKDQEQIKEWRSNLWYFVSKFTEFDAKKLYKLYKHTTKKGDDLVSAVSSPEKREDNMVTK